MPAKKSESDEVAKAEYDTPLAAKTEENPRGGGLKYVGPASTRIIRKEHFVSAGITDQDTVTFSRSNNFTVKKSDLSKSALNALERDNGFISVALDD